MRISDWSSDVCSSDLGARTLCRHRAERLNPVQRGRAHSTIDSRKALLSRLTNRLVLDRLNGGELLLLHQSQQLFRRYPLGHCLHRPSDRDHIAVLVLVRSEEHTSELQSLMRISYAVFCFKKKKN